MHSLGSLICAYSYKSRTVWSWIKEPWDKSLVEYSQYKGSQENVSRKFIIQALGADPDCLILQKLKQVMASIIKMCSYGMIIVVFEYCTFVLTNLAEDFGPSDGLKPKLCRLYTVQQFALIHSHAISVFISFYLSVRCVSILQSLHGQYAVCDVWGKNHLEPLKIEKWSLTVFCI